VDALYDPASGAVPEVCTEFLGLLATTADVGREVQLAEQPTDEVVVISLVQADALGMLPGRLGTLQRDALDRLPC
jgi:hypothetical protein